MGNNSGLVELLNVSYSSNVTTDVKKLAASFLMFKIGKYNTLTSKKYILILDLC